MKVEKSYRLYFLPEHVRQSRGLTIDSLSLTQESKRRQSRNKRIVFFLTLGLIAKAPGKSKSSASMRVAMVMVAAILMD